MARTLGPLRAAMGAAVAMAVAVAASACSTGTPGPMDAPSPRAPAATRRASAAVARSGAASDTLGSEIADEDDPNDANDPATLQPIVARDAHLAFTRGTVSERECWRSLALTGNARRDYAALVARCGKPTGAVEYARPAVGQLDDEHDKHDTFIVFLRAGLCYRFFGVADATIPNLDIVIERNGALAAEGRTRGPVAIIDADHAWCVDSDAEYRFVLGIAGEGRGHYVFGVWARRF